MAFYHEWDVKNGFAYVLQFFSLISDDLGGVTCNCLEYQRMLDTLFFQCIEKMSHANCPVCQEDLHTSREPCQIPPCHHLLHKSCFDRLLANSHFYCPICYGSLMDLSPIWKLYKKQIQNNPMPERYQVLYLMHLN